MHLFLKKNKKIQYFVLRTGSMSLNMKNIKTVICIFKY